jgi:hypothetical protein
VRVSGLQPATPYFFQTQTTPTGGGPTTRLPAAGARSSVVTERDSAPLTANGLGGRVVASDGTTPVVGALLLIEVAGRSHPLSALAGDGYPASLAAIDLANLYAASAGMTLPPLGGEAAVVTALGGSGRRAYTTTTLAPNPRW